MIPLKRGQIFCTENPMLLGKAINLFQWFWSSDGESKYTHAGIVISDNGDTFESLLTIKRNHLDKYIGKRVLIGELVIGDGVTRDSIDTAINTVIDKHLGCIYPAWRVVFHILPPLAKFVHIIQFPVCSELVAKFLKLAGMKGIGPWAGKNPDHVADWIHCWDAIRVIYEGELPEDYRRII